MPLLKCAKPITRHLTCDGLELPDEEEPALDGLGLGAVGGARGPSVGQAVGGVRGGRLAAVAHGIKVCAKME